MPAGSERRRWPCRTPGDRSACASPASVFGGHAADLCVFAWFGVRRRRSRDRFTVFQRGTLVVLGLLAFALRLRAGPLAGGGARPTGWSSSTATGAASFEWAEVVAVHLPPGAPVGHARPGRRHDGPGDGASRAPTATGPARRCRRAAARSSTSRTDQSSARMPQDTENSSPGCRRAQHDQVLADAERVGLSGHRLDRERAAGVLRARRRRCRPAATVLLVDPQGDPATRGRRRAPATVAAPSSSRSRSVKASSSTVCRIGRATRKSYAVPSTSSVPDRDAAGRRPGSRVAAGRVSSQPSTGPAPTRRYGWAPEAYGAGESARLVAVWVTVRPSADRS